MANDNPAPAPVIIHVGSRKTPQGNQYLILKRMSPHDYVWFEKNEDGFKETDVSANSIQDAMRLAHKAWKDQAFRTVICGFRYTLPERDEHGMNALFHQMAASYKSPNGIYFDEELGHNCHVQNASQEALSLLKSLS